MPSSYTNLLGFVLPVTGELSGTWGTTVNAQLTQLIEDSIAGYATSSVTAGNWTLSTTSSGASNEARMMVLVPTGAPGVSRDIYAPKLSKTYIVVNRSDAVVVLRGGPGTPTTGMTIPAGVAQVCVWDPSAADFRPVGLPLTSRTGSAALPAGTTAQRDSAPARGWFRANSDTGLLEWYDNAAWKAVLSDTTRVDVASAATVDLTAAGPVSTRNVRITGTTTITAVTIGIGQNYLITFSGALTLTNNAAIVTNTGANITTGAGDTCVWRATAADTIEVLCYSRAAGASATQIQNLPDPTLAANAMTLPASTHTLDFRSNVLSTGAVTTVTGTAAALVIPSGATLGTTSAVQSTLIEVIINNGGTLEKAIVNLAGGNDLSETGTINTTAISAGATSANVFYSNTARTGFAYRVVRSITSTQATAGQWATAPSLVQGAGGEALTAMSSAGFGQTRQELSGSRAVGTTYYNTTRKAIYLDVSLVMSVATQSAITVGGVVIQGASAYTGGAVSTITGLIILPGVSYSVASTNVSALNGWVETR